MTYSIAPGTTAEEQAAKRRLALALMTQGSDTSPVQHWTQGAARALQGALGGYEMYAADKADKDERAAGNEMMAKFLVGGQGPSSTPTAGDPGDAIASIESGGKYDALGPVTKTGDRAYGKYQVMGANIPQWTKAYAGAEMTPDQFIADPKVQDAVFKGEFGRLSGKHGPEGAARAWFAGEGGMNDPNRKDQLGTSVAQYGQKFAQALGGPTQAQAQPQQPNRELLIQMLQNRHTAPMAQRILEQQMTKGANFGVIGEDEFGKKTYGWIDPRTQRVTPLQQGGPQQGGAPTVTGPDGKQIPIPAGVNPKKFRDDVTGAVADAATGKLTEVQANSTQFANRMEDAEGKIKGIEGEGTSMTGKALSEAPWGLATVGNYLKGENRQKFEQARSQFITGLLRRESGAAIAPAEFERYDKEFFPQPGDSEAVIEQKREARKVAIEGMKKSAGPGYKSPTPSASPAAPQKATGERKTIGGKSYVKQNGQWFEE